MNLRHTFASVYNRTSGGTTTKLRSKHWLPSSLMLVLCAFVVRNVIRTSGYPFTGDWVPVGSEYLRQVLSAWDPLIHGGMPSLNFRLVWLFVPLGALAGHVGTLSFALVNSTFFAFVSVFPALSCWTLWTRYPVNRSLAFLASIFWGFNPWITAQTASGHVGIVLAYALLIWLVFPPIASTYIRTVVRGILLAILASLDPHTAVIGTVCLITAWSVRKHKLGPKVIADNAPSFVELILVSLVAVGLSLYWLLPDLLILRHLQHVPLQLTQSTFEVKSLSRLDDPFHLMGLRSFWWLPFSNGFYGSGISGVAMGLLLDAAACSILIAFAVSYARKKSSILQWVWIGVPVILTQWAWLSPSSYSLLTTLPGGALLRDPNATLPFAILGLMLMIVSIQEIPGSNILIRIVTYSLIATTAVALAPWVDGSLNGYLRPLTSVGGESKTVSWINANSTPSDVTLWLPATPYISPSWTKGLITDPLPYWTTAKTVNPIEDPAYDFTPSTSLSIETLQNDLVTHRLGSMGNMLGKALRCAGIHYVVVQLADQPTSITSTFAQTLSGEPGIRAVKKFQNDVIYEVFHPQTLGPPNHERLVMYDGTWESLMYILAISANPSNQYVSLYNAAGAYGLSRAFNNPRTVMAISDLQAAALALGPRRSPIQPELAQGIIANNNIMYLHQPGTSITLGANGLFALQVMGLNSAIHPRCNGQLVESPLVNEQPDVSAKSFATRWIGFSCRGKASVTFMLPTWVGQTEETTKSLYNSNLNHLLTLLTHPGSVYFLKADQFASYQNGALSSLQDPLEFPQGSYHVGVKCQTGCGNLTIQLASANSLSPIGPPLPATGGLVTLSEPTGKYRVVIRGRLSGSVSEVYFVRVSPQKFDTSRSAGLTEGIVFGTSGSPAPWKFTGGTPIFGPVSSNMFNTVLVASSGNMHLTLSYITTATAVGSCSTAAVLLAAIMVIGTSKSPERKRRFQRPG